jgi:hypothetical protein
MMRTSRNASKKRASTIDNIGSREHGPCRPGCIIWEVPTVLQHGIKFRNTQPQPQVSAA